MKIDKDKQRELAPQARAARDNPALAAVMEDIERAAHAGFLATDPHDAAVFAQRSTEYRFTNALFVRLRRALAELSKADA